MGKVLPGHPSASPSHRTQHAARLQSSVPRILEWSTRKGSFSWRPLSSADWSVFSALSQPRPLFDLGRAHLVTLLRLAYLFGKLLDCPKKGRSGAVGIVAALLPMLQSLNRDSEGARKRGLAHAKSFPDRFGIGKFNDGFAAIIGGAGNVRDKRSMQNLVSRGNCLSPTRRC
jgi:hypothetical protein